MILRKHLPGLAAGTIVGALVAGGISVASAATPGTGHAAKSHPAAAKGDRRAAAGLAARAEHGTFVVRGKKGVERTLDVQRGTLTAVSASSVTIKSLDGFTATYALTPTSRLRVDGAGKAAASTLRTGEKAAVTAVHTATGDTVLTLRAGKATTKAPAKAGSPTA